MKSFRTHPVRLWTLIALAVALGLGLLSAGTPGSAHNGAVTTDKADYAPDETVIITGTGFGADESLDIPVIRPGGTIVTGDGTFTPGWDTVVADGSGNFTYSYVLDGILGNYEVQVYHTPWGGDDSGEAPLATTTFTDHNSTTVVINGTDVTTTSLSVTLTASWSGGGGDPTQARFANDSTPEDSGCSGVTYGAWTTIVEIGTSNTATFPWTLLSDTSTGLRKVCSQTAHGTLGSPTGSLTDDDIIFYREPNPALAESCGLDIVLVMDSSGSLSSTELGQMKTAFNGFVAALLPGTPTQMAVVDFDTSGTVVQGFTNSVASLNAAINGVSSGGFTNWDDALDDSRDLFPGLPPDRSDNGDLIIFASDGNPNYRGNHAGLAGHAVGPASVSETNAMAWAVAEANAAKLAGIRILALGVGDGLDVENLKAISGNTTSPLAPVDVTVDVITGSFSDLNTKLAEVANKFCKGKIIVHKIIDDDGLLGTTGDQSDGVGWTFSANTDLPATVSPASSVTDASGFIDPVFALTLAGSPPTSNTDVVETLLPGYTFISASCLKSGNPIGTPGSERVDNIVVNADEFATCTFYNQPPQKADVKKLSLTVLDPPQQINVSQNVPITLRGVLHNNGPKTPVDVTDTTTATAPPDCSVVPAQVTTTHSLLQISETVTVDHGFTIHCTTPSFHTFSFTNCVAVVPPVTEDTADLGNNCKTTQLTVAVIGQADPGITSFTCSTPPQMDVSQTVGITCIKKLLNTGPFAVTVKVDAGATPPPDCSIAPPLFSQQVFLPKGVPVTVVEQFTIHCLSPSFHTFRIDNRITPKDQHIKDINGNNNNATWVFTVAVIGKADLKKVSIAAAGPPQIDVSENALVSVTSVVHNNGPFGPVGASDVITASAPPDCTVNGGTSASSSVQLTLLVSNPSTTVGADFTIHCTSPSFHTFTFCNDIGPKDEHVEDPISTNNLKCVDYTVAAIGEADLKQPVVVFPPGGTGTFPVSEDILIPASVTFHNNGPFPVYAQDVITISFPADCAITVLDPLGNPIFGPVPGPGPLTFTQPLGLLPKSVSVTFGFNFSVHCTEPSFHTFIGQGCIEIDPIATLHVVDPDPINSCFVTTQTYALVAQADLKKVSITADGPPQIDVSEDALVSVSSVVHNNGPFGPVGAGDTITASAPPDCTVNGGTSASSYQQLTLPVSEPSTTVGAGFTIHCTTPSFHTFTFCNDLGPPKDEHVEDPIPTNNHKCVDYTVAVIAEADVKLTDVQIPDGEVAAPVSEDVPFSLSAVLHNNGPAAASAQVSVSINLPADCTLTLLDALGNPILVIQGPGPLSFVGPVLPLPVSELIPINANFTVHCFNPSFHVFSGQGCINIVDGNQPPHVIDPDPDNNCFSTQATFAFEAEADLKKSFGVGGPPTANVSEDFEVGWGMILHNNGPFGPVNLTDTMTVTKPDDCTVTPPPAAFQLSLAADAGIAIDGFFTLHCMNPSFHDFEFCNEIQPKNPHVVDPEPGNNKVCVPYTVAVTAEADVSMTLTCSLPPEIPVSETKTMICTKTMLNSGPFPVTVQVTKAAAAPPDCTVSPDGDEFQTLLSPSVPTIVVESFDVHCTTASFHDFGVCNDVDIKDEHVEDPNPIDNHLCVTAGTAATAKADLKVTGVVVTCDDPVDTATPFNCKVDVTVHNNGPYGLVNANVTVGLSGPADCPAVANQTSNNLGLAKSVSQTVTKNFTVTCANRSFHTFTGSGSVVVNQLHVSDPVSTNNSGSGSDTISVFNKADLKVQGVVVTCDDPVDVNTPFDCDVDVTVHNNGPTTPVNADVTVGLAFTPQPPQPASECTLTPAGNQGAQDLSLVTSVPQVVSKTWSVTCNARSFHKFTGSGSIAVDQLHVRDPNTANNSGSGDDTNSVFDLADVKVTSTMISCPPSGTVGTQFSCTVTITIHNNGPLSPVSVGGALNVGWPIDCIVENYSAQGQGYGLLSLVTSVSQNVVKTFNITCALSGDHEFTGCGIVQPNQLHVRDPNDLINGNNHGSTAPVIVAIGTPGAPGPLTAGRCDTFDPVEVCDGIDNDNDGFIDEEPDTDLDGTSDCVDTDDDNDGFSDEVEVYIGTNPLLACPAPPDFDSSLLVDISDVLALKPVFGNAVPQAPVRFDIATGGSIDISDVLALKPYFNESC